jgi:hypothetical protein
MVDALKNRKSSMEKGGVSCVVLAGSIPGAWPRRS